MMHCRLIVIICLFSALAGHAQAPVELFPLRDVRLLDGPFKQAQENDRKYLLALDPDRLLAPFLREAGLTPKAANYGNWESSGLDGHIGGHYLSALSLMFAATGDPEIKARLDYLIAELKKCQDALGTGYIGGVPGSAALWEAIRRGDIQAGAFDLNKRWVPLYNIHKTYAGLRDAYLVAGLVEAREMLIKMTDWMDRLVEGLTDEQLQQMLRSEHGGLNEVFADVAAITGDARYLTLARRFSHHNLLQPLLSGEDRLTGLHANTQIPKVIGFKRIADLSGDASWDRAARFFWETVVTRRSVVIGGNSAYEHFHPADDFSRMIRSVEGPETCNTYNMLRLTVQLFCTAPEISLVDYYERALFNHILSTQHPESGGLVYFTPMRPGHYRVYSQPQTSFWCCVGSGLENHAKYGEFIYAHRDDELFVNLFIASALQWPERGIRLTQQTRFPEEAATTLIWEAESPTELTLVLRYPEWVKPGELAVLVNGQPFDVPTSPGSFIRIRRRWQTGDQVQLALPMHTTVEQLPDSSNYFAFLYGPVVLAAKTDTTAMTGLFADDSRGGHIAHGPVLPLRKAPILVGEPEQLASLPQPVAEKPLHFTLRNVYSAVPGNNVELIPFYRLHESRYILYWPQATEADVSALISRFEEEERDQARIDQLTVDRISVGQQQPETDHNIQFDRSVTGLAEGETWREAAGWFSYRLRNTNHSGRYLLLRYFDADRSSDFTITINGELLADLQLDGKAPGDGLVRTVYPLPDHLQDIPDLIVRFDARNGRLTARIVEVRLLSGSPDE